MKETTIECLKRITGLNTIIRYSISIGESVGYPSTNSLDIKAYFEKHDLIHKEMGSVHLHSISYQEAHEYRVGLALFIEASFYLHPGKETNEILESLKCDV